MSRLFPAIQKLGKALMLPIAVLPVAGLLLRLGQPDLLDLPFVAAAGDAIFANLGLLFAIGVAVGFAKSNNGTAGLAAVVAYLVTTEGAKVLIEVPPEVLVDSVDRTADLIAAEYRNAAIAKLSVPAGLLSGILAGNLYNRYAEIRLPDYLAFFAGRRFVPIVSGFAALAFAATFGLGWPVLENGMNTMSGAVVGAGEAGLFAYGLLNRILIVTGLHHILNNLAWFLVGDFEGVTGDLRRYFAGDPSAGTFMSGFFPVMMFGLPAACLAMYRSVDARRRKTVGGLLLSMALTSFLTGITEPIEFAFMFVAPLLYALHAILTGLAMVTMDLLGVRLGFGFSAGLFDYVLNFNRSTRPLMLLPIGFAYFVVYYTVFRFCIVRFNLKTPGREAEDERPVTALEPNSSEAERYLIALGGKENLLAIDACMTRLRLRIARAEDVDKDALRSISGAESIQPTRDALQVVVGLRADEIATDLRRLSEVASEPGSGSSAQASSSDASVSLTSGDLVRLLDAMGGRRNIEWVEAAGTRLRIQLKDGTLAHEPSIMAVGLRGIARPTDRLLHVLAHGSTEDVARRLQSAI